MEGEGQGQGSGQEQGSEGQGTQDAQDQGDKGKEFDKDRAMATIRAQRESEAALKKELAATQAKLKEHEDAKLSETEKIAARLADAERKATNAERDLQEARADRAIERAAAKVGFVDPEDAVLQLNRAALQFEDDGTPKKASLEAALKALGDAKPHLLGGKGNGSWDGGARKTSPAGTDMNERIREALRG